MPQFRDMRGREIADPIEDTSQLVRPTLSQKAALSEVDREAIAAAVKRLAHEPVAPVVAVVGPPAPETPKPDFAPPGQELPAEPRPLDLEARIAALEERVSRLEHPMGKPFKRVESPYDASVGLPSR